MKKNIINMSMIVIALISYTAISKADVILHNTFIPSKYGEIMLTHSDDGFKVKKMEGCDPGVDCTVTVDPNDVSGIPADLTTEKLLGFLDNGGRLFVTKIGNDYGVKATGTLEGGGPIFGAICYWGTKVVGYAVVGLTPHPYSPADIAAVEAAAAAAGVIGTALPTP